MKERDGLTIIFCKTVSILYVFFFFLFYILQLDFHHHIPIQRIVPHGNQGYNMAERRNTEHT